MIETSGMYRNSAFFPFAECFACINMVAYCFFQLKYVYLQSDIISSV